jgi:hypothetical protein
VTGVCRPRDRLSHTHAHAAHSRLAAVPRPPRAHFLTLLAPSEQVCLGAEADAHRLVGEGLAAR